MQATLSPPKLRPSDSYLASATVSSWTETGYLRSVAQDYGWTPSTLLSVLQTPEGRVKACKTRPLLFTLLYIHSALELKSGPNAGQVTMNTLSLDFFRNAYNWTRPNEYPGERRVCEVAARESGKSLLLAQILPLYLLCTSENREFVCIFTSSHPKSKERMSAIRKLLGSPLIKQDYPHVIPAKRLGYSESDTMQRLKLSNGSVLFSSGITSTAISGLLDDDLRVSCSILDDVSPSGGGWSLQEDDKRLQTLREVIYDLGRYSRIFAVGTTVAYGSLIHTMLIEKDNPEHWSNIDKWDVRYHKPLTPAILEDGSVVEESYWPKAFSTEYLQELRDIDDRMWGLNWLNAPVSFGDGTWFTPELFVRAELPSVAKRVISIDPGVSDKKTSDPTGICIASFSNTAKKACIDECISVRARSVDLKRVIVNYLAQYPDIDTLAWEDSNGGSALCYATLGYDWVAVTGVKVVFVHPSMSKEERTEILLSHYKHKQVIHRTDANLKEYEAELLASPAWLHSPNCVDSASQALDVISKARIK